MPWVALLLGASACYSDRHPGNASPGNPSNTESTTGGGDGSGGGGSESESTSSGGASGGASSATGRTNSGLSDFGGFGGFGADGSGGSDSGGMGGTGQSASCASVLAEPLPARLAITSLEGAPSSGSADEIITVTKSSLFREFERLGCGDRGCHGGADAPLLESPDLFKMTLNSFAERPDFGTLAHERILSSDPDKVMPPGSGDGSELAEDHPLRVFAERLLAWQEQGYPEKFDIVIHLDDVDEDLPDDPYLLSPDLAAKLTNIGSCLPHTSLFSLDSDSILKAEMEAKDKLFEGVETSADLPETLIETDLVSMDSAVLARRGVYSYAPAYTLFSDHAGKMRHVRVPVGASIDYNPETKDFDIPDNTRFYKTFLKRVVDKDGVVGYRKMETRLIVVRRDEQLPDGSFRPRALRATYAWDREERMARYVHDPLRNGEPFADRLCPYVVDETEPRDPTLNPISDQMSEYCEYMTEEELADPASGKIRHYGIPSAQRCDQCHMGSNNHSYILGFNPWQVDRRPDDEGGVYDQPATLNELGQLKRLIDYGVITGIEPGEAKLEESQGARVPRNDYELRAQGYMLGNCAFCHNPHGFPVVQNPLLMPFNLFPNEEDGGIFQFSLERYSPRAKAGKDQNIRFPYITPAFGDHVTTPGVTDKEIGWGWSESPPLVDFNADPLPPDVYVKTLDNGDIGGIYLGFLGPWRSLIWRNVYTPFTYNEDFTIFVHMPRNAPGYDCRAHKIMAEWMLSIPSTDKPDAGEHQPVVEVLPGEEGYAEAAEQALQNIDDFNFGLTGYNCPADDDIVDPKVVLSALEPNSAIKVRPSPADDGIINSPRVIPENLVTALKDGVPDHAHWVPTDTTDPPGTWVPRRPNWEQIIATREVDVDNPKLDRVIDQLQGVHLSEQQKAFSLDPLPMGLWASQCQDSSEAAGSPTVEDLLSEDSTAPLRRWLQGNFEGEGPLPSAAHVHFQSRGEAVFRAICMNCHGKEADSRSPLAATILELTGGQTRVANFVDGLFGPRSAPGAFARDEFLINQGASPAEWQVRYMLFMGLGGTLAQIPRSVLDLVAFSPFYGEAVMAPGSGDPNMLDAAFQQCAQFLGQERTLLADAPRPKLYGTSTSFNKGVGHYELWESLCTFNNEPVVFAFSVFSGDDPRANFASVYRAKDDSGNWIYPPDHPVGNQSGGIDTGIQPENTLPWCIELRGSTEQELEVQLAKVTERFEEWGIEPSQRPMCPASLFTTALGQKIHNLALVSGGNPNPDAALGNQDFTERWLRHGAMNAGMAAYYYLNGLTSGQLEPSQPFDACGGN